MYHCEIAKIQPSRTWLQEWLDAPGQIAHFHLLSLPFPTYEQIWRGFLPDAQSLPIELIPTFHSSYLKTYIERDIRLLADLPDLHQFTRFVKLAASMTAQEINYQELGRELGIANMTAKRWLSLLREVFEWHEIPSFSMNSLKKLSLKSKGYFADTGQVAYCQAISSPHAMSATPLWGGLSLKQLW